MAEENKEEVKAEDSAAGAAGGGKKKKMIIGLAAVLVIALGAGGYLFMASGTTKLAAKSDTSEVEKSGEDKKVDAKEHTDAKVEAKEVAKDEASKEEVKSDGTQTETIKAPEVESNVLETYSLSQFNLNVGNPMENRYLRMSVSLEFKGGKEQLGILKRYSDKIKNIIIDATSTKTTSELRTNRGRNNLAREVLHRVNEIAETKVTAVYFTEFIVE